MADVAFLGYRYKLHRGEVPWHSVTGLRVMLLQTTAGTPLPTLDFVSDLTAAGYVELVTVGYNRQDIVGRTVTRDDDNLLIVLDATNNTWNPIGPEDDPEAPFIRAVVVYLQVGGNDATPEDDILVAYYELAPEQVNNGPYTLKWNELGAFSG